MIKVKVCGMTDAFNLKRVAQSGPDFLGFIFYPGSPRYVSETAAESLIRKVPDTIEKVGVFVDETPAEVIRITKKLGISTVQLHGSETPAYCEEIRSPGFAVIKSFAIDNDFNFEDLIPFYETCDFFLFDTRSALYGGTGVKFDWSKLNEYIPGRPFFLSGGIGPEDAWNITGINHKSLYAIDINSRFETSPGIKDPAAVEKFIIDIKKRQK